MDLHEFVEGRRGTRGEKQNNLDAFKVPIPVGKQKASKSTKKGHKQNPNQDSSNSAHHHPDRRTKLPHQAGSEEHNALLETDASNADESVTNTSARPDSSEAIRRPDYIPVEHDGPATAELHSPKAKGLYPEFEDYMHSQQAFTGEHLNARQVKMMEEIQRSHQRQSSGISHHYVPGDSYPSTTSGRPSVADLHTASPIPGAALPSQSTQASRDHPGQQHQVRTEGFATMNGQDWQDSSHNLFKRPTTQGDLLPNPESGFVFGKRGREDQKKRMQPPASLQQQIVPRMVDSRFDNDDAFEQGQAGSAAKIPSYPATRGSVPFMPDKYDYRQERMAPMAPLQQNLRAARSARVYDEINFNSKQSQGLKIARVKEPQLTNVSEEPVVDDDRPDFDLKELMTMDYSALKSLDYDTDPRAEPQVLPEEIQSQSLEDKVRSVLGLSGQDQGKFFESLSIDDWEQAGDWFVGEFADVFNALKENRRQRRSAAQALEDEIEARNSTISKKQHQTEDALNDMKQNGGKILQGTPKRTQSRG